MGSIIYGAAKTAAVKFTLLGTFIQVCSFATVNRDELYQYMSKHRDWTVLIAIFGFYGLFHVEYRKIEIETAEGERGKFDARNNNHK